MAKLYLDTNIILSYILDEPDFDSKKFYYKLKHYHNPIVVPQIIVGETMVKIVEKSNAHHKITNIQKFTTFLEKDVDVNSHSPPLDEEVVRIAMDIMRTENRVDSRDSADYFDALIVGHAVTDSDPCWLFTSDGRIHNSEYILELARDNKVNLVWGI